MATILLVRVHCVRGGGSSRQADGEQESSDRDAHFGMELPVLDMCCEKIKARMKEYAAPDERRGYLSVLVP